MAISRKIQIISRLPADVKLADIPGPFKRILQNHLGLINPPSFQMPGTRVFNGWRAVHFAINSTAEDTKWLFDTVNAAGILDWRLEAGQDFTLTRDPETGEVTSGVYLPVPLAMCHWLEDVPEYDQDGNITAMVRPECPASLHIYVGADQWVWAEN